MWSDHLFYCRPKLIFQHNGLFVFCDIVTIIMTSALAQTTTHQLDTT